MLIAKTMLLVGAVTAAALASPPSAAREATPLARLARGLVRDGAPGAIVAVRTPTALRRGASGLGSREPAVTLRATDRFRAASITKSFVATVVLELVAEGKLRLDDPVERWLPGLVPDGRAITIRQLLSHTSGLPDYQADDGFVRAALADPAREWSPRQLVAIAVAHRLLFPQGTGWSYWNTNYVLLGLVLEAATGQPLGRALSERLVGPLRLTATSFPTGLEIEGHAAHGYVGSATLPEIPAGTLIDATSRVSPSIGWAAGAIVSDADDVTRFYAALLGGRLLRPGLLAAMRRTVRQSRGNAYEYGLGIMRFATSCGPAYGHIGGAAGYRSVVYARPNGRRVAIVMVNIDETRVTWGDIEATAETALCGG